MRRPSSGPAAQRGVFRGGSHTFTTCPSSDRCRRRSPSRVPDLHPAIQSRFAAFAAGVERRSRTRGPPCPRASRNEETRLRQAGSLSTATGIEVRPPWLHRARFALASGIRAAGGRWIPLGAGGHFHPTFTPPVTGVSHSECSCIRQAHPRRAGSRRRILKRGGPTPGPLSEVAASTTTTCRRRRSGRCSIRLRMPRPTAARSATRSRSSRSSNSRRSGPGTRACRPSRAPPPSSGCPR